ncbi:MAG: radical SAM protein [Mariprofundales bacterium]|nr:radical SAM protein [Mariprofundales bacterium]
MTDSPQLLRIFEIYSSIQGESTLAGTPCTLVRLAGCPLRCHYCDTPAALSARSGQQQTVAEICEQVRQHNQPLVLVTGGEPLSQPACIPLLKGLLAVTSSLQLETSGSIDIAPIPIGVRRIVDIKTPGSGEVEHNLSGNLQQLRRGDELKFVITSREDYLWSVAYIKQHHLTALDIPLLISPAYNHAAEGAALAIQKVAEWIVNDHLPLRLQPQLHKWIWGAEASGV